jgi:NAD(P)-dependent dehydrogenase (short-subunit alcohol dehydrogenase family)
VQRIVVVTGASQGIGLETTLAFARAGDTVVATSRDARRVAAPADVGPGRIETASLDVTDDGSVGAFAADLLGRNGRVDVVVNNAGRGFIGSTEELSIADMQLSLEVNLLGVMRMTKAFLPAMREAGRGHLIAVSSIGGAVGQPFNDAYCAAKFAVEGLYESLYPVAAASGVYVSLVQPGPVRSDHRSRALRATGAPELSAWRDRYESMTVSTFARAPGPERVAEVILSAANDPAPKLRYQTSRLVTRIVGMKLSDLSGEAITTLTASWIAEPIGTS